MYEPIAPEAKEEKEMTTADLYFPGLNLGPRLAHYYGDYVRKLFIVAAALMLILAPFLPSGLWVLTLPFDIVGALVLVALAALTNPKKELIMLANAAAAGIGLAASEVIALSAFANGESLVFIAREVLAFVFVLALYFALKTLRAMRFQQVGKRELPGEFLEDTDIEAYREHRSRENRRGLWN
mgnify:CR=1 FL=1